MPDIFGNPTPQEVQQSILEAQRQRQADFARSPTSTAQSSSVIGDALGSAFRKTLDTRNERRSERERLIAEGVSEKNAKAQAKDSVPRAFAATHRARKVQQATASAKDIVTALEPSIGITLATAAGWIAAGRQLKEAGFPEESAKAFQQGVAVRDAEEKRLAALDNVKSETRNRDSTATERDARLESDLVNLGRVRKGKLELKALRVLDAEGIAEAAEQGFVEVSSSTIGIQFTAQDMQGSTPPTRDVQEDIIGGINMLNSIGILRKISDDVGFDGFIPVGAIRAAQASFGFGEQDFIDAVAARKKMRADIQSIIKGIPSNYDAGIFEAIIPDPGAIKSKRFYDAQLDVVEQSTSELVRLTIAFHKGTSQPIPKEVIQAAHAVGISTDEVVAMSDSEISEIKENKDSNVFTRHQKAVEARATILKAQKKLEGR